MNSDTVPENKRTSDTQSLGVLKRLSLGIVFKWAIPLIIVILAILFVKHQMATRPKAIRQKPPQEARLVRVEAIERTNHKTVVSAMGAVVPAKQITLSPEVTGRIIFVSPLVIPGGVIEEGQILIRIDARDYEAVVKQRESEAARAELNLKLEEGNQLVSQQEYELLGEIIEEQDEELILRKPHLQEARASLDAAKAALAKAELDVDRCTVKAPFNAVIQEKFVDVGAQVTMSSPLLTIMGSDEYWVEVLVPVNQLRWITVPDKNHPQGSLVKIFNSAAWESDVYREGVVVRLLGQLEEQGRMAQLLVSVRDPLSLESDSSEVPPILVDSYVRVEVEGTTLEGVFPVNRDYLHDGDNIWIMNEEDRMEIVPVEVVFRDKEKVYLLNDLRVGDRIVTTAISAPVAGMLLRLNDKPDENEQIEPVSDAENSGGQE